MNSLSPRPRGLDPSAARAPAGRRGRSSGHCMMLSCGTERVWPRELLSRARRRACRAELRLELESHDSRSVQSSRVKSLCRGRRVAGGSAQPACRSCEIHAAARTATALAASCWNQHIVGTIASFKRAAVCPSPPWRAVEIETSRRRRLHDESGSQPVSLDSRRGGRCCQEPSCCAHQRAADGRCFVAQSTGGPAAGLELPRPSGAERERQRSPLQHHAPHLRQR